MTIRSFAATVVLSVLSLASASFCSAAGDTWKDPQGKTFKAEASGVLGPFAVFRVDSQRGRRLPLDQLSAEDCQRFNAGLKKVPSRASSWKEAQSEFTKELAGFGCRIGDKLVHDHFEDRLEPEYIVLVSGSAGDGDSWKLLGEVSKTLGILMKNYPGIVDGFFFGFRHNASAHRDMTKAVGWPGLLCPFDNQSDAYVAKRFFRSPEAGALVLSRNGVPLLSLTGFGDADIQAFCTAFKEDVALSQTTNPRTWGPLLHFLRATRLVDFAHAKSAPVLVGNPLRIDVLAQRNVSRLHATIKVTAAGRASGVQWGKDSRFPDDLEPALTAALEQGLLYAPAVENGVEVEGVHDFVMEISPEQSRTQMKDLVGAANIRIRDWLVLKPIKVASVFDEAAFAVQKVDEDGSVTMRPVYVGADLSGAPSYKAQKYAFETDYFEGEDGGVEAVSPSDGQKQYAMGDDYVWKHMVAAEDGSLNFQTGLVGLNWVIAYAYAEFESPKEGTGYVCLGSDDSSKVWVNGKKVHQIWINRPVVADDDIFPVQLTKGKNRILVKVQNFLMPEWGMNVHVMVP